MGSIVLIAIVSFIATNLDDLLLLMIFFAYPDYKNYQIIISQYLGISTLIIVSTFAYFFRFFIPSSWINLLGIFPISIGIQKLLKLREKNSEENDSNKLENKSHNRIMKSPILVMASIVFANGGDNISVYAPLFANLNIYQLYFVVLIFLVMIGIWCFIGHVLVNNRKLGGNIRKYGHIILPFALILIGISILTKL